MTMVKTKCDFCKAPALYDTQTKMGPWANVCQTHFDKYSTKVLGLYSVLKQPEPEATLHCVVCGQDKSVDHFYHYTDGHGVKRIRRDCKECNLAQKKKLSFKK